MITATIMPMTTAISTIMAPPGTITTPTRTRTIRSGPKTLTKLSHD